MASLEEKPLLVIVRYNSWKMESCLPSHHPFLINLSLMEKSGINLATQGGGGGGGGSILNSLLFFIQPLVLSWTDGDIFHTTSHLPYYHGLKKQPKNRTLFE